MSDPGQATAYMLGRLAILEMRSKVKKELGDKFDLKEFHYQVITSGLLKHYFLPLSHVTNR